MNKKRRVDNDGLVNVQFTKLMITPPSSKSSKKWYFDTIKYDRIVYNEKSVVVRKCFCCYENTKNPWMLGNRNFNMIELDWHNPTNIETYKYHLQIMIGRINEAGSH